MRHAELLEAAAMRIFAGLKETNMVQVLVADEMKMDLMEWVTEFAAKFRLVYNEQPDIKQAIDTGNIGPELIKKVTTLLQQPNA